MPAASLLRGDVTEKQWLRCANAQRMLGYFQARRFSSRKLRLFAVACCSRLAARLGDERMREAVRVAELYADGRADAVALQSARTAAKQASEELEFGPAHLLADACAAAALPTAKDAARKAALWAAFSCDDRLYPVAGEPETLASLGKGLWNLGVCFGRLVSSVALRLHSWDRVPENCAQAQLLHDIVGNPFRRPSVDALWLRWNDACVPRLAGTIYDQETFDLMPILADALEDAGCANPEVLGHCRTPGVHVRGCWVLDLILGKA
jgi:hypothetical protein